ncbi:MAG: hypothetical protein U0798_15435 [Gemmataceae bacterium]
MLLRRRAFRGAIASFGMVGFMGGVALADDPPAKTAKPDDKPADAKSEFAAIKKDFQKAQQEFFQKLQGMEDRKELQKYYLENYPKLTEPFVKRVDEMEKKFPDAVESTNALFWLVGVTQDPGSRAKLTDRIKPKLANVELKDLSALLGPANPQFGTIGVIVFDKVKKAPDGPVAEKLLGWVAQSTMYGGPNGVNEAYNAAVEMLVDKYPQSTAFMAIAQALASDDNPKWAAQQFRKLLEKNKDGDNRLLAQFGLANMIANEDGKEKEALAMLEAFMKEAKGNPKFAMMERMAKGKILDIKMINNPIQEITGEDLDGKEFKISDYKGKVVLLDFWGFW